jgi:hypothetical protein
MCKGSPLKKIGFQKKKGTSPHFTNIENINTNQGMVKLTVSQKLFEIIK